MDTKGEFSKADPASVTDPFHLPPATWTTVNQLLRLSQLIDCSDRYFEDETTKFFLSAAANVRDKRPEEPAKLRAGDLARFIVHCTLHMPRGLYEADGLYGTPGPLFELLRRELSNDINPLVYDELFDVLNTDDPGIERRVAEARFISDDILQILSNAWNSVTRVDGHKITVDELIGGLLLTEDGMTAFLDALADPARQFFDNLVNSKTVDEYLSTRTNLSDAPGTLASRLRKVHADAVQRADGPSIRVHATADRDRVAFGRRVGADILRSDPLGRAPDAIAMAELICLRTAALPMAIGLFGNWGAGKSTFMGMLEAAINEVTSAAGPTLPYDPELEASPPAFVKNVVHIRFNAWHYADADLWASIGTHIFDELANQARDDDKKDWLSHLQLDGLIKRLDSAKEVEATASERMTAATNLKSELRERVAALEKDIAEKRTAQRNAARQAVKDTLTDTLAAQVKATSKDLGFADLSESADEIRAGVREISTIGGRAGRFATSLLVTPGWTLLWILLGLSTVALLTVGADYLLRAVPVILTDYPMLASILDLFRTELSWGLGATVTALSAVKAFARRLGPLFDAYDKIEADTNNAIAEAEAEKSAHEAEIEAVEAEIAATTEQIARAQEETIELEAMRRGERPSKLLAHYIENRASGDDYRQHLGLVSILSRDFQRMSELMAKQSELRDRNSENKELPSIDRIVLYIDDLDRCQPALVVKVLEAVHLILAYPLFVVVVGVDPRWLEKALKAHHRLQFGGKEPGVSARDYLEKIFQIPYQLIPPNVREPENGRATAYQRLITDILHHGDRLAPEPQTPRESPGGDTAEIGPPITELTPVPLPPELDPTPDPLEAARTQTVLDRVTLTPGEEACLGALGELIGHSPRMTKRVLNLYRIVRARWPADDLDRFLGTTEPAKALYPGLMLKLALDATGEGEKLAFIYDEVTGRAGQLSAALAKRWVSLADNDPDDTTQQHRQHIEVTYPSLGASGAVRALQLVTQTAQELETAFQESNGSTPILGFAIDEIASHPLVAPYSF